jgi:glycerol dehydrogenase-like iron-containing ADH family enzyme
MGKSKEVTFPDIALLGDNPAEMVRLLKARFGEVVGDGPILVVTGPKATQAFADAYARLIRQEWSENLAITILKDPPSLSGVVELEQAIVKEDLPPRLVIYVGSQTVADSAKALVRRLRDRYKDQTIIFGGVITGLSGDGIFSSTASLRDDDGIPMSENTVAPNFILGDKPTLLRSPFEMKSSGIGDILSKISSLWDYRYSCSVLNKYHDNFAADLAHAAFESLLRAKVTNKLFLHKLDSIETLFRATQLCGLSMQLTGSSETASGSEHVGEKWLQEFIIRLNKRNGIRLDTPKHGAALTPMTIITLYLQGQSEKAEEVKEIARNVGLPCTARELGVSGTVLQMCLALGFGFRCPRYVTYLLGEGPFPDSKDVLQERVTVLEQVEFKVLLDAIRQSMIDSEVSSKDEFGELDAAPFNAMQALCRAVMVRLEKELEEKVGKVAAARVCREFANVILRDYYWLNE